MREAAAMAARVSARGENKRVRHFGSMAKQSHAAKLGMWVFLATEVLFFGGLFAGYTYYDVSFTDTFTEASRHLSKGLGTIMTLLLLVSSLLVALSSYFTHRDRKWVAVLLLLLAAVIGVAFLGLKATEWAEHLSEKAYPGAAYAYREVQGPGASMFFTLYYLLTGLHAVHVTIGVGVLIWLAWLTARGAFSREYDTPLELGGMYWHFVDIVWVFLYPMLYLQ